MKNIAKTLCIIALGIVSIANSQARERWSEAYVKTWYDAQAVMAGFNYMPANSINQLEMWQEDTFDPSRIDLELSWAQELGFNVARVFLHDLAWQQDPSGFFKRVDKFLQIADKHNIKVMFVFFDACWYATAKVGKQPEPRPFKHNSGWLQSPNAEILLNENEWVRLEAYVKAVVGRYKDDSRIVFWDVYNEPGNSRKEDMAHFGSKEKKNEKVLALLEKSFEWVYSKNPSQPVTSAVWNGGKGIYKDPTPMEKVALEKSDIVSFHVYSSLDSTKKVVESLKRFNRPLVCSEYMARTAKSTFNPILGYFVDEKIASFCWGFVNGKTQTIYPWDSNTGKIYIAPPEPWFHDVLNTDGTPYKAEEADYIKKVLKGEG